MLRLFCLAACVAILARTAHAQIATSQTDCHAFASGANYGRDFTMRQRNIYQYTAVFRHAITF